MYDFGSHAMTQDELQAFLSEPRYCALASLRKDGSPFVIPLGFMPEGDHLYFTFAPERSVVKRLRRDARVSVTIFTDSFPPAFVLVVGEIEEVPDPDLAISIRKHRWIMQKADGIDHEEFERNHFALGRVVFRLKLDPKNMTSSDAGKAENLEKDVAILPGEKLPST